MSCRSFALLSSLILLAAPCLAQVSLEGTFTASKSCPAYQAIKKQTNPGGAAVAAGQSYPLIGKNKDAATDFLVEIVGAEPTQRWVSIDCERSKRRRRYAATSQRRRTVPVDPVKPTLRPRHRLAACFLRNAPFQARVPDANG